MAHEMAAVSPHVSGLVSSLIGHGTSDWMTHFFVELNCDNLKLITNANKATVW